MSTRLSTVLKFFLFIGAFVFAMTVSAPRVFASLSNCNNTNTCTEWTGATLLDSTHLNFNLPSGTCNYIYYTGTYPNGATTTGSWPQQTNCGAGDFLNFVVTGRGFDSNGPNYITFNFNSPDVNYYVEIVLSGDEVSSYSGQDSRTRFISLIPTDGSTVATTSSVGFQVYVNEIDFSSSTKVIVTYTNDNCNSTSGSVMESIPDFTCSSCRISTTTDILSSGYTTASSTHTWLHGGRWNYVANISNETGTLCLFGFCLFSDEITLATENGIFIVGQLGAFDVLTDYIASSTATDVSTDLSVCAVWTTTGDVFQCFRNLLLPSDTQWKDFFTGYSGAFLTYPPLGYITKVIQILNDPTVVKPPALSYTFGSSSPAVLQGKNYTIQIFDNFDKVTLPVADDGSGKNIWDIVMPYFRVIVGFAVLFVITMDIIGVGLSSRGGDYTTTETGSETVSSSSMLPSGERKSFTHSITKRRRLK